MDAEEKYNQDLWFVLNKIKDGLLRQSDGNTLSYRVFVHPIKEEQPHPTDEQALLKKLEKLSVIKVVEKGDFQVGEDNKAGGISLKLKVYRREFDKHYEKNKKLSNELKNTLVFSRSGLIEYTTKSLTVHKTSFKPLTNPYRLLDFLVHNPLEDNKTYSFSKLARELRKPRKKVEYADDERRVRDTIQSIRVGLGYNGDELFNVDKGFSIKCKVSIKE